MTDATPEWAAADAAELAGLEAAFAQAGGRGVDLADRIDKLRDQRAAARAAELDGYSVEWTINMDGRDHREAAAAALAAIRDRLSDAMTFRVRGPGGCWRVVDLDGEPEDDYWDSTAPPAEDGR